MQGQDILLREGVATLSLSEREFVQSQSLVLVELRQVLKCTVPNRRPTDWS